MFIRFDNQYVLANRKLVTSVARPWTPRVSCRRNRKFRVSFSRRMKDMGHSWWLSLCGRGDRRTNGQTDKQMDSIIA